MALLEVVADRDEPLLEVGPIFSRTIIRSNSTQQVLKTRLTVVDCATGVLPREGGSRPCLLPLCHRPAEPAETDSLEEDINMV